MKLALLSNKITYFKLPKKVNGNFWMPEENIEGQNLVNIESYNNMWIMNSSEDVKIISGNGYAEKAMLLNNTFYVIEKDKVKRLLYAAEVYDTTFKKYKALGDVSLTVGKSPNNDISYNHNYVIDTCAELRFSAGIWSLQKSTNAIIYKNDELITSESAALKNGDNLFIYGLRIIVIGNIIMINNPSELVTISLNKIEEYKTSIDQAIIAGQEEIKERDYYCEQDYFLRSPRLRRFIETFTLDIASPPGKKDEEDIPILYILGPMLATGMSSAVTLLSTVTKILDNETTLAKSWPSLLVAVAMMSATLLWPNLTKRYKKKKKREKEELRQTKYIEYLNNKRKELNVEHNRQIQILQENLISTDECKSIILNKKRELWERKIVQKDFLTVRVGKGNVPLDAELNYQVEEFSLEEDTLKKELENLGQSFKTLVSVPFGYSFLEKRITNIMGIESKVSQFIKDVVLQFIAFHGYDELKIVILTDKKNEKKWDYLKRSPHCFSNDKQIRFFASTPEERKDLNNYLNAVFYSRRYVEKDGNPEPVDRDYRTCIPYFVIITDIIDKTRKLDIIESITETEQNVGFSLIIQEEKLGKLPSGCTNFISLGNVTSGILENSAEVNKHQDFNDELELNDDIYKCCDVLANIPIHFDSEVKMLPNSLSFLDMYNVGNVDQLNSMNRWTLNNPMKSLRAEIGIDENGEPIVLDLHEKFHGPHGLMAGMTGSGKSEFIITYVLSMAVNYSPNEVAFILIDYKGGGLVGAFENKKLGVKLPHLAGTITNLDKAEMNRTLVSIDSELRRRQTLFNEARDQLGESTIDIYKYQKFFREGKLQEPMPHLFIVCDEFAELKSQQPDFMNNLISTARIGRSLGVHLILATQKPSGVVNDQILSNSKFRICLKVQDKSDSNEMIKCPNAAELKQAGRFYLQVGYNEIFLLGQSGWCGAQYFPSNTVKKPHDRSVGIINNIGYTIVSAEDDTNKKKLVAQGEELTNILEYVTNIAKKENVVSRKLWLDSIPEFIYVDALITKYNVVKEAFDVDAIIGEYDDPNNQLQNILTLPLTKEGNTIIYSISSSDRERAINAILYSVATRYSVDEANFYIVDFGSESLRVFSKFPHIGDMAFSSENEKIVNLFKMIGEEIEKRKKLFADYSGQYATYCKDSGNTLPLMIVIINDYDAFSEADDKYNDDILKYSRDGERYGVIFILTANSQSAIRTRIRQNFKHELALELNDRMDYMSIVGSFKNVCLFELPGRGLVNLGSVFEFQTASIYDGEDLNSYIRETAEKLIAANGNKAPKIPILPEFVSIEMLQDSLTGLNKIPIGMNKDDLVTATFNFMESGGTVIAANEMDIVKSISNVIMEEMKMLNNNRVFVIDPDANFKENAANFDGYIDNGIGEFLQQLLLSFEQPSNGITNICVLVDPSKIKSKIGDELLKKLSEHTKKGDYARILFVSTASKMKDMEFDAWYSAIVNKQNGIWVGQGVVEQSVFRVSSIMKAMKATLDNSYGWHIKNGNPNLIKLIGYKSDGGNNEE